MSSFTAELNEQLQWYYRMPETLFGNYDEICALVSYWDENDDAGFEEEPL